MLNNKGKCVHPKYYEKSGNSVQKSIFENYKKSGGSSCQDGQSACNPGIFGFKQASSSTVFCVDVLGPKGKDASKNCRKLALSDPDKSDNITDKKDARLGVLKDTLKSSPDLIQKSYLPIMQSCVCKKEDMPKHLQRYGEKIRTSRACYSLLDTMNKTKEACSSESGIRFDSFKEILDKYKESNLEESADLDEKQRQMGFEETSEAYQKICESKPEEVTNSQNLKDCEYKECTFKGDKLICKSIKANGIEIEAKEVNCPGGTCPEFKSGDVSCKPPKLKQVTCETILCEPTQFADKKRCKFKINSDSKTERKENLVELKENEFYPYSSENVESGSGPTIIPGIKIGEFRYAPKCENAQMPPIKCEITTCETYGPEPKNCDFKLTLKGKSLTFTKTKPEKLSSFAGGDDDHACTDVNIPELDSEPVHVHCSPPPPTPVAALPTNGSVATGGEPYLTVSLTPGVIANGDAVEVLINVRKDSVPTADLPNWKLSQGKKGEEKDVGFPDTAVLVQTIPVKKEPSTFKYCGVLSKTKAPSKRIEQCVDIPASNPSGSAVRAPRDGATTGGQVVTSGSTSVITVSDEASAAAPKPEPVIPAPKVNVAVAPELPPQRPIASDPGRAPAALPTGSVAVTKDPVDCIYRNCLFQDDKLTCGSITANGSEIGTKEVNCPGSKCTELKSNDITCSPPELKKVTCEVPICYHTSPVENKACMISINGKSIRKQDIAPNTVDLLYMETIGPVDYLLSCNLPEVIQCNLKNCTNQTDIKTCNYEILNKGAPLVITNFNIVVDNPKEDFIHANFYAKSLDKEKFHVHCPRPILDSAATATESLGSKDPFKGVTITLNPFRVSKRSKILVSVVGIEEADRPKYNLQISKEDGTQSSSVTITPNPDQGSGQIYVHGETTYQVCATLTLRSDPAKIKRECTQIDKL